MNTLAASIRALHPPQALERATLLLDAGFEKLVMEDPLHADCWQELRNFVPREGIAAIRLFLPYPRGLRPGEPSPFRLGSPDREERRDAQKQAAASLQAAAAHSIPLVLMPVVRTDLDLGGDISRPLPSRPAGGKEQPSVEDILRRRFLDAYKITLSHLLDLADRYELTLCVTPSDRREELPAAKETADCFREFEGAPLGTWLDPPRVPAGLEDLGKGGSRRDSAPDDVGPWQRLRGVSLHDVRGAEEGLLPGSGEVDWERLRESFRACPLWVLDLRLGAPSEEAIRGYDLLEGWRKPNREERSGPFLNPFAS